MEANHWFIVDRDTGTVLDAAAASFVHASSVADVALDHLENVLPGRAVSHGVGFRALVDREAAAPLVAYVLVVGEYFDRVNGNSYFGGGVIATVTGEIVLIRFQYGRGELAYLHAASEAIGQDIYDRERGTWSPSVQIVRVPCGSRRAVETLIGGI